MIPLLGKRIHKLNIENHQYIENNTLKIKIPKVLNMKDLSE